MTGDEIARAAEAYGSMGATDFEFNTMRAGFRSVDEHLAALRRFREKLRARRRTPAPPARRATPDPPPPTGPRRGPRRPRPRNQRPPGTSPPSRPPPPARPLPRAPP